MGAILFFSNLINRNISASALPPRHNAGLRGRELTTEYKHRDVAVHVSCTYSPCRTKCIFSSTEFGDIVFDRNYKVLISSTRTVHDRYIKFLARTLDEWEKYFDDFDLRPYRNSGDEAT